MKLGAQRHTKAPAEMQSAPSMGPSLSLAACLGPQLPTAAAMASCTSTCLRCLKTQWSRRSRMWWFQTAQQASPCEGSLNFLVMLGRLDSLFSQQICSSYVSAGHCILHGMIAGVS